MSDAVKRRESREPWEWKTESLRGSRVRKKAQVAEQRIMASLVSARCVVCGGCSDEEGWR